MCTSDSLSQFYPIRQAWGSLVLDQTGWRLFLRHRHFSGGWDSCCADEYEHLTIGELLDVLDAHQGQWTALALTHQEDPLGADLEPETFLLR